jgi:hypothetical protein
MGVRLMNLAPGNSVVALARNAEAESDSDPDSDPDSDSDVDSDVDSGDAGETPVDEGNVLGEDDV